MEGIKFSIKGYLITALLGIVGGGLLVAMATKIVPTMMSEMMGGMMDKMKESGRDPQEI